MNECRGRRTLRVRILSCWVFFLFTLCLWAPSSARAQAVRSQSIVLQPGWNAIYLEVDPQESDPAKLLADSPVDIVAAYTSPRRGAQFALDPQADMRKAYGWAVWYAPERPDAFLSTLYGVYGAQPYLVHARTNATLVLTGPPAPDHVDWTPDAYNFVGFSVQDPGGPTLEQFFRGSSAHRDSKIYRMVNGAWRQVLDPSAAPMRSGEAFWIYCRGRSDFRGPLQSGVASPFGVQLSSQSGDEIVFRNRTSHPVSFRIEHIADAERPIPISAPVQVINEAAGGLQTLTMHFPAGNWQQDFPPLEAGQSIRFPLTLRARDMDPGERSGLLRVVSDVGTVQYIPVAATREDHP